MEEYKRFTISLPQDLYDKFESFRKKLDVSRSDAIRKAMNAYLVDERNLPEPSTEIVGCITMVTKHEHFEPTHQEKKEQDHPHTHPHEINHTHEYQSKPIYANVQQVDLLLINDIQHHFTDIILSTMHIHLEFEKCMEIIAVSGPFSRVTKLKEELQRLKSIVSIDYFTVDKV
ncbi:MAG: CopG family ribbon-helix-helix protein [Promethearchaeota archaeon]